MSLFRRLRRLFALALALATLTAATPALAEGGILDLFGSIFGSRRAAPPEPLRLRPARRPKAPKPLLPANLAPGAPTVPGAPLTPGAPPTERPAPTYFIAVIGDSQAGMLAQGLQEAFADDPRVSVVNKSREDTGLVREDFYDWRAAAKGLLEGPQHFDMAIIEIGINDNQKMRQPDNVALDPLSKPFNEVYAKRVEELAALFHDHNVPLVWVGLPIMRSESLSAAALVFNDIDRQYSGAQGAHFVDLWEAFSDVNSAYRATGPDVSGAIVRQRAGDGVHFNKAGARKAAHFIEPEIRRALEARLQPTPAEPAPVSTPGTAPKPETPEAVAPTPAAPPPKPLAGKVQPLGEPALSPGGTLAGLPQPGTPLRAPEAAPSQPGRADDFHWTEK